jgi:hypothetical protein
MSQVGTREINNVKVEVHASGEGSWSIYRIGKEPTNERHLATDPDSLEKAVNKARLKIKQQQVTVAVKFKTLDGRRGTATNRHARSHDKVLVVIEGKKDNISGYTKVLRDEMPKEEVDHLKEIQQEKRRLDKEERKIMQAWTFNLGQAVDRAIKEAAKEQ